MPDLVHVGPRSMEAYRGVAPDAMLDDLVRVASELRGARVLHVNATPWLTQDERRAVLDWIAHTKPAG